MSQDTFDPVAEGHKEAEKNSKGVRKAVEANEKVLEGNIEDAQKLAKKNAKLDRAATTEAEMKPQDVGTSERDIPEGAPVTDEPEESHTDETKAASKDADVKKDLPDDKKRQDTTKDSATPSPSKDGEATSDDKVADEKSSK